MPTPKITSAIDLMHYEIRARQDVATEVELASLREKLAALEDEALLRGGLLDIDDDIVRVSSDEDCDSTPPSE